MLCDQCGERPAAVHLTQIVDSSVTKQHLCDVCAEAKGVKTDSVAAAHPLSDFIASLGGVAEALPVHGDEGTCASCGGSLADFRETGRLGCPACYDTFDRSLRTLLRRVHGASRHVGERYRPPGGPPPAGAARLNGLRDQLTRAIEAEQFELAAELRDQIRGIE